MRAQDTQCDECCLQVPCRCHASRSHARTPSVPPSLGFLCKPLSTPFLSTLFAVLPFPLQSSRSLCSPLVPTCAPPSFLPASAFFASPSLLHSPFLSTLFAVLPFPLQSSRSLLHSSLLSLQFSRSLCSPLIPMCAPPPFLPASAFFASPSLLHSSLLSLQSSRSLCSPLVPMCAPPPFLPASAFFASPSLLHSSLLSLQSSRSLCSPLVLFAVLSFSLQSSRSYARTPSVPPSLGFLCKPLSTPFLSTLFAVLSFSLQSSRSLCSPLVLFAVFPFLCAPPPFLPTSAFFASPSAVIFPLYSLYCSPCLCLHSLAASAFFCKPLCRGHSSLLSILQSLSMPSQPPSLSVF